MCWDDRYSKGIWAVCLPGFSQCQAVRDASEDGDLDMIAATEYLLESSWLPVITGTRTLLDSLSLLEARLATLDASQLSKDSDWSVASYAALEHFMEVRRAENGLRVGDGVFRQLPADFSIIARGVERQRKEGGDVAW
ncbi:hypothetical protein [Sphingomonas oryzagri]